MTKTKGPQDGNRKPADVPENNHTPLPQPLQGKRILVAGCGSIAAVKLPQLVSALVKQGATVRCVLSPQAEKFVSPLALSCLSRQPCSLDQHQWEPHQSTPLHIALAEWAELILLAPLSSATLAHLAHGFADNLLCSTLLATRAPVVAVPAMNTDMWANHAVQRNWQALQRHERLLAVEPTAGLLACDRVGLGRMPDPELLTCAAQVALATGGRADLAGTRLLCTAGPTREFIDSVRCLTNPSSGRMGAAMALVAHLRGAAVELVHGPLCGVPDSWLQPRCCYPVTSAGQMARVLQERLPHQDGLVMAAAVADHAPAVANNAKLPKADVPNPLPLQPVADLAATIAPQLRPDQWMLGFAAEQHLNHEAAFCKLQRKGFDWIFVNAVGSSRSGFGQRPNGGTLLAADGSQWHFPLQHKVDLACSIWSVLAAAGLPAFNGTTPHHDATLIRSAPPD